MTSRFERPFFITKIDWTSVSYKAFLINNTACSSLIGLGPGMDMAVGGWHGTVINERLFGFWVEGKN